MNLTNQNICIFYFSSIRKALCKLILTDFKILHLFKELQKAQVVRVQSWLLWKSEAC